MGSASIKDFLLIGEFCEVYGPRSVFTVPSLVQYVNSNDKFNLDEFLLYIMTTDYQSFSGDKWEETSDVVCIRTNVIPHFHAILHYFTLKDPQARGGVRPSCIAYVSQNQTKLYRMKEEVCLVIAMSAQIIKHANARWLRNRGQPVMFKENIKIVQLLDKWSHVTKASAKNEEKKLENWVDLCPGALPLVISGMSTLHQVCSRSLEDQILDQKTLCTTYDLFNNITHDAAVQSLMTPLNNVSIN